MTTTETSCFSPRSCYRGKELSQSPHSASLIAHTRLTLFVHNHRVLARLDQLPPAVRDNAMLAALERLGSLSAADPDLLVLLSQTQFVPTASGQLVTPTSLYDPRVPELLELLDASRDLVFPDPDSAFSSAHTLNTLSRLGLRSGVTLLAVLDSARHA